MAKSIFRDKAVQPDQSMLKETMGEGFALWEAMLAFIAGTFPQAGEEWKFYGNAWGWSLAVRHKNKGLCYLTPGIDGLQVSMSFNEKGREAVRQTDLPESLKEQVELAQYNPAGKMFDLTVACEAALPVAMRLLGIKART